MPPTSMHTGHSRVPGTASSSSGHIQLPTIFLLVLAAATGLRLIAKCYAQRKRIITMSCPKTPEEKDPSACQAPPEADSGPHHHPQPRDQPAPAFKPIYPWIAPPQPLPGPYDPQYFPLPTLRRHSHDLSEEPSPELSPEPETISEAYTRRVSTNSLPARHASLHGTVTVSSTGTRRNHWVVTGG